MLLKTKKKESSCLMESKKQYPVYWRLNRKNPAKYLLETKKKESCLLEKKESFYLLENKKKNAVYSRLKRKKPPVY